MRITSNRMIDHAAAATSRAQESYSTAADVVTSGLRVATPSDDPTAWLSSHRAKLQQQIVDGSSAAWQYGRDRLAQTDSAVTALSSIVSQVRELAIQGASETYDATTRASIGTEVRGMFEAALGAANTQSPDGEYLLAGSTSLTRPFDATGAYQGDANDRVTPDGTGTGATHATTLAGSELTAAHGVDVLPLLDRVATALATNDLPTLQTALGELGTAIQQLATLRARSGGMMSAIDSVTAAHATLSQTLAKTAANFVEVDTVGSASKLAQAGQALQASQVVSAHVIAMTKPPT